jgi:ferredoxin-NADP reductase
LNRLAWRIGRIVEERDETPTARTLVLDVPDWPGHLAGQHLDVRLTAPDGYRTQRSYSIASAEGVELTVQRLTDGEVSPYLTDTVRPGDPVEVRGPIGGWFVWRPQSTEPVNLFAGGSGVVPLMAMVRARAAAGSKIPFRLLYSVRTPADVIYADELRRRARDDGGLDVSYMYSRTAPAGSPRPSGRITVADVNTHAWPAGFAPTSYVCGPTAFVETVADILLALDHDPKTIRTERFG